MSNSIKKLCEIREYEDATGLDYYTHEPLYVVRAREEKRKAEIERKKRLNTSFGLFGDLGTVVDDVICALREGKLPEMGENIDDFKIEHKETPTKNGKETHTVFEYHASNKSPEMEKIIKLLKQK